METAQISLNIVVALHEGIIVWGTLVVFPVDGLGNGVQSKNQYYSSPCFYIVCLFRKKSKSYIPYYVIRQRITALYTPPFECTEGFHGIFREPH